ncbi:MAG: hypothetical protein JJE22_04830 [Bacteroidia bacterium]|nr:hypothetical protein [Bacteroidia bacterium]
MKIEAKMSRMINRISITDMNIGKSFDGVASHQKFPVRNYFEMKSI